MKQITFENIYKLGNTIEENEQYRQVHYPEMLNRYDSNFIEFKLMPSLSVFKDMANNLREFHFRHGQNHEKYYLPANEKPGEALIDYLEDTGYETGFLELYAIQPDQFPLMKERPEIKVGEVTADKLDILLDLQYKQDVAFGREFAKQKTKWMKRQFDDPNFLQLMAFYQGTPAGYVDIIIAEDTAEIDNLTVLEPFQRRGIGSNLQKYVMEKFVDKIVILVADGEDTPSVMYQKQNYQYIGFQYEVQKIY
ncbi:GNAT family N-acetyltransferase [Virgibacillus ainsalahensis]